MRRLAFAIALVTALAAAVLLALNWPRAEASPDVTITVNSTADTNVRDSVMTLREAMLMATGGIVVADLTYDECQQVSGAYWSLFWCMSPVPIGTGTPETIVFDTALFPPGSPQTISLGSDLPTLYTGGDTIDGSSAGVLVNGVSKTFDCFDITCDNNTIKGLEITNCRSGVVIHADAQDNTIGGSSQAERNVISGNAKGVLISGSGTDENVVNGNYIGTNAAGDAAVRNTFGVLIVEGAQNNTVGGSTAGERNVISGNEVGLIISDSGTNGNIVKGNYIGTNASGTAPIPNLGPGVGIQVGAQNNTVGGNSPGERNVISGNNDGVRIVSSATSSNVVKGNYIGINASGTAAIPNRSKGVYLGAPNNTVGGSNPGEGNVISGNDSDGLCIAGSDAQGNAIEGNCIGTDASGTAAVSNGAHGVLIWGGQNNTVGGSTADKGNTIAFNDEHGVQVQDAAATGNTIRGNAIYSNGGKGIENIDGGNTELSPPTIHSVGSVFGTACPNCIIDVYSDDKDEGEVYEGNTAADGTGNWSFPGSPQGPNVTATATDGDGNTSEFSAAEPVPEPTPSPSLSPTATPTPGATRTLVWGPGWHNVTWSGASTPEEVFACAAGNYAAAYRLVSGGWERYFPARPDLSNMTDLAQYDAFLIPITGDVTCEMPVADTPSTERTLDWGVGWQNDGWTGADGTEPQDAFACAENSYAAAYRLVGGGWERHFPGRPDVSNMEPLSKYDPFLILVTAPLSCTMAIAPQRAAGRTLERGRIYEAIGVGYSTPDGGSDWGAPGGQPAGC